MSIQSEIDRIAGAKADIVTAIESKGVTVPDGTTIDGLAALILEMGGTQTVGYGTCETAAATAAKVVTIANTAWTLEVGSIIGVKFTYTNTASSCTINVNGTGAKNIWVNNAKYTSTSANYCGYAKRVTYYMYDGTYWVWLSMGTVSDSNTVPSAYCVTAAATAAKTATCTYYTLTSNSYVHVITRYANTKAGALTLNINSTGAKPIYINGAASSASNYTLPAGTYIAYYDGTNFYFRTDGKLTANITGNAATATKATQDGNGNVITSTYATIAQLNAALGSYINDIDTLLGGD